jgi:hypothetical protein
VSAFSDAYRRIVAEVATEEAQRERERSWADLGAWLDAMVVPFDPPQDAPALGYHVPPVRTIGAEVMPDATLPTVTARDPIADLVRAYRLIEANPGYRPDLPGPDRWVRWSDVVGGGTA